MRRFILFTFLVLISFWANAREMYSRSTAFWTNAGAWSTTGYGGSSCGCVITNGDTIYIKEDHSITVDASIDYDPGAPMVLHVYGELKFTVGKLDLPQGSKIYLHAGGILNTNGGGGSSDRIRINGNLIWSSASGDYTGPMNADEGGFEAGLPVKIIYFTSKVENEKVSLLWGTSQEINNQSFEVQRSFDGINFSTVEVINGQGTVSTQTEYTAKDIFFEDQQVYYRLKQTDFNGAFSYSEIITVLTHAVSNQMKVYPNPAESGSLVHIHLSNFEESLVVLTDHLGNELYSIVTIESEDGINWAFPTPKGLKPGIYYIKATSNNQLFNEKLVIR